MHICIPDGHRDILYTYYSIPLVIILTNKPFGSIFISTLGELQNFNDLPPKMAFWMLKVFLRS